MARGMDHLERLSGSQGDALPIGELPVDPDRAPHELPEPGDRPLLLLEADILDPGLLPGMGCDSSPGGFPYGLCCPDVVRVGMGEDDQGDIIRFPAGLPEVREDGFFRPGNPAIDQGIPPGVQIRKTVTVRATAPVGARTMNGIRTG